MHHDAKDGPLSFDLNTEREEKLLDNNNCHYILKVALANGFGCNLLILCVRACELRPSRKRFRQSTLGLPLYS